MIKYFVEEDCEYSEAVVVYQIDTENKTICSFLEGSNTASLERPSTSEFNSWVSVQEDHVGEGVIECKTLPEVEQAIKDLLNSRHEVRAKDLEELRVSDAKDGVKLFKTILKTVNGK